jgi:surfactin synthase thioesterase subunit
MKRLTTAGPWLRTYHPVAPDAPFLVCFPHAGGSASFFFSLSRLLTPNTGVLAVQYPGRQDRNREPLIDNVPELADRVFEALAENPELTGGKRRLTFFGHSMGSAVAFEVAVRLRRAGLPGPVRFFASARRAPGALTEDRVHLRDDDGIIEQIRELSGTDARALGDEELMRMALPAIRNDYHAIETYRAEPGARIDCPVTVLIGDDDPTTTVAQAAAWKEHTTAETGMQVFPGGGHFYLNDWPADVRATITRRMGADADTEAA